MAAGSLAVFCVLLLAASHTTATDVVWYISPTGSADIASCGRSPETPCNSLQLILDQSEQFDNDTVTCYLSAGTTGERDSTTLYFMGEENFVPPVCLMEWRNLRVVGLDNTTIRSGRFGADSGVFEFINCTNVTIENLNFVTAAIGKSVLFFEACRDISVTDSMFPVTALSSLGVQILHSAGDITLSRNLFYGDPSGNATRLHPLGLDITHGCTDCTMPFTDDPYDFSLLSFSLSITGCVFQDLANEDTPTDNYGQSRNIAVAMRLRFREESVNNIIVVSDSVFRRIRNSQANGVLVSLSGRTGGNVVTFTNCTFQDNTVRYGGGVAAYFYDSPSRNTLDVQGCVFSNNTADFEGGGLFAVFLSSGLDNTVLISNSTFVQNRAWTGSGVFLLNNPFWFWQLGAFHPLPSPLVGAELRDCFFEGNNASLSEAVVNVLRVDLNISGVSNFTRSMGSAVLLRVSLLSLWGEVTFSDNTAVIGGALCILDGSKVDMSAVTGGYFLNNRALFQGGAIYGDTSSTSHLAVEFNHTLAQHIFGGCFILFGNEVRQVQETNPRRFTFSGNTAYLEGQNILSYSLQSCLASNFIPREIADQFLAIPSDGTIFHQVAPNSDPLLSTTTGPSFLFFYGASTRCYKRVSGVTYLLPNCSHSLLNSTFYLHPNMRCGLLSLTDELNSLYDVPGTGLRPTVDKLIAPWAATTADWTLPPEERRSQCPEQDPSNLVLSPAPGEQFDLTVQLADQLLNYVFDTVFLDVEYAFNGPAPGALLQFNGLQFGVGDRIYFSPNRPLSQVALVGTPGTEGHLRVVASSQIMDQFVSMRIPFQLAHCPKGYYLSTTLKNATRVNELITGDYRRTQRIPTDPYNPLACHCFSEGDAQVKFSGRAESLTNMCVGGYTVQLSSSLWAGFIPGRTEEGVSTISEFPDTIPCTYPDDSVETTPIDDRLTNAVNSYRQLDSSMTFEPIDVVSYFGLVDPGGGASVKCFADNVSNVVQYKTPAIFSIDLCSQGYCRADARSEWVVANESFPCAANRMGPLCGRCKPGYAVTLYSSTCRDCTEKPAHYYLSLIFTLAFGLVLVLLVIVLNIGATPTVDSLLFFIQAVYLLLEGRSDYENFKFLAFFNPNFTFDLCITPTLDNLTKLILQYVTPFYILILMAVILMTTYFKRISRLLGKYSILQGLWLLFLISYFNIAMATFEILYCRWVGPIELNDEAGMRQYVLVHDPSVQCYSGLHLPFAIIAWVIAIFFALPLPVYVLGATRVTKLKPLSDAYCSCYKDHYRWWIFVSLARRLLLVLVGVFAQNYVTRHFGLLVSVLLVVLVTMFTTPYKSQIDNYFTLFVTWMLLLTAVVTQPDIYLTTDPLRGVSLFLVVLTIVCGLVLLVLEIVLLRLRKKTLEQFYQESLRPKLMRSRKKLADLSGSLSWKSRNHHELEESTRSTASTFIPKQSMVDATAYREPLLDSQFYSAEEVDKFGTWAGGNGMTSTNIQTSYASLDLGLDGEEKPFFNPKKFHDEDVAGGVSVTEVSTGPDTDSGEASTSTRYFKHTTS